MGSPRWSRPQNRSNLTYEKKLLKELIRRERLKPDVSTLPDLYTGSFAEQRDFIDDQSTQKVALCSRQAGKSTAIGIMIIREGLLNPGCTMHYVVLNRDQAKKIMFKEVLQRMNMEHALGLEFRQHPLSVKFPNESICYFVGADSNEKERRKLRGTPNRLVIIDEAQDFTINLKDFIKSDIRPGLWRERGTLVLAGTPGQNIHSFFHKVSTGGEPGWSVHHWTAAMNPYMVDQYQEDIAKNEKDNPNFKETNEFKREFLGQWVIDLENRCYVHNASNVDVLELPKEPLTYIMGVDPGFTDAFACVVVAYSRHDKKLYVVDAYAKSELMTHQQAEVIRDFQNRYPLSKIIVDHANKTSLMDLRYRYSLNLSIDHKTSKSDHIKMLNSDLALGTIKLLPLAAERLIPEWEKLVWDRRSMEQGRMIEKRGVDNHLSDAFLYAWRAARNWMASPKPEVVQLTQGELQLVQKRKLAEKIRKQNNNEWWDSDSLV